MKTPRILMAFAIVFAASFGQIAPASACATCDQTVYAVTNVNSWASLREWPSTSAPRLAKVPKRAPVFGQRDTRSAGGLYWLKVNYKGQDGWIPNKYLRVIGTDGEIPSGYNSGNSGGGSSSGGLPAGSKASITNVQNWASLRSSASRSSARITRVPRGNVVRIGERIYSNGENWYAVFYQGDSGWIPAQYLSTY